MSRNNKIFALRQTHFNTNKTFRQLNKHLIVTILIDFAYIDNRKLRRNKKFYIGGD